MQSYRLFSAGAFVLSLAGAATASVIGPEGGSGLTGEYARFSDSPFANVSFSSFYFENFEDHLLNVPGVTTSAGGVTSVVFGPQIHDSVDTDDGVLDGSGLQGDSYFAAGTPGVLFAFSAAALGSLPTHAGLVWTDGDGDTSFEAFDQNGVSLGSITVSLQNGSFNGETSDDFFFGATNAGGISGLRISNAFGGIEVDHLQYGIAAVPEPATYVMMLLGLSVMGFAARRRT